MIHFHNYSKIVEFYNALTTGKTDADTRDRRTNKIFLVFGPHCIDLIAGKRSRPPRPNEVVVLTDASGNTTAPNMILGIGLPSDYKDLELTTQDLDLD